MIAVVTYIIKFSISITLLYAFYAIFLRRLTFYSWNRLYLLFYSLTCFFIPLINLDRWLNKSESNNGNADVLNAIPPFNEIIPASNGGDTYEIVFIIFSLGAVFYLAKLFIQYLSFRRMNKNAVLLHHSGNIRIYSTNAGGSFTLGNNIYLDTAANQTPGDIEKVLQHEMIHVRQKHWIDLLAGELLCLVNWFNPFAWLLRASIRQNLEYIADRQVLQKGYDIKEYQYLLLRISNMPHVRMAAHFSLTGLKNRIHMINKIKSARVQLARFVLIFPLLLLLLFAFRTVNQSPLNAIGVFIDTTPVDTTKDSIEIVTIKADTVVVNDNKFSKNIIYTGGEEIVVIQNLRTKEIMTMTMSQWNKNPKSNERRYGKLPKPPIPPVPPVPPTAPEPPVPVEAKANNVPEVPVVPAPPAEPAVPAPPVPPTKKK